MSTTADGHALPVIAIRPEPGLSATIAAARERGLAIAGFPLFAGEPVGWDAPDPAGYAGLLAGSAALFRLGSDALDRLRALPVHAVGGATAAAARAAGFAVAATGEGGLDALVRHLPAGRYLRPAGEARVPLDPPPGVAIDTRIAYRMVARPLPAALAARLAAPALVLLHAGEAARHFAAQCDARGIARSGIALAALAPRIAAMAGPGWRAVGIAAARDDAALLALAGQMCQTVAGCGKRR